MSFTELVRRESERETRRVYRRVQGRRFDRALRIADTSGVEVTAVERLIAANGPEPTSLADLDPSLSPETDA